jgi:hypothetical protein
MIATAKTERWECPRCGRCDDVPAGKRLVPEYCWRCYLNTGAKPIMRRRYRSSDQKEEPEPVTKRPSSRKVLRGDAVADAITELAIQVSRIADAMERQLIVNAPRRRAPTKKRR